MYDLKTQLCLFKHIHYFLYFTGILTLPILPIYPAIMLSLGIYGKITILHDKNIIPIKTIICILLYSYYNNLIMMNIYINLLLTPILLSIYLHFLQTTKIISNNIFIDYLYGGYNYNKLYINQLINNE
tara:strand:- start:414 stop:797 length:384 start_codon:yes stop_codon:yes gene_type:complete